MRLRVSGKFLLPAAILIAAAVLLTQVTQQRGGGADSAAGNSDFEREWAEGDTDQLAEGLKEQGIVPYPAFCNNQLRLETSVAISAGLGTAMNPTDNDMVAVTWSVNGAEIYEGGSLAPDWFRAGDTVEARIERTLPTGEKEIVARCSTLIRNSPPQIGSVTLRRSRHNPGFAQAYADVNDADGHLTNLTYQWKINGRVVAGEFGELFPLNQLERGQSITVSVSADDGRDASPPVSSGELVFDNSTPEIQVSSSARALEQEDGSWTVSCAVKVTDPDGDPVKVEIIKAPAGISWDNATGSVVWVGAAKGLSKTVTLRVDDGKGGSTERDVDLKI